MEPPVSEPTAAVWIITLHTIINTYKIPTWFNSNSGVPPSCGSSGSGVSQ